MCFHKHQHHKGFCFAPAHYKPAVSVLFPPEKRHGILGDSVLFINPSYVYYQLDSETQHTDRPILLLTQIIFDVLFQSYRETNMANCVTLDHSPQHHCNIYTQA